ncbi:DUF86 domain-containing protein [Methylocystis parvus]|uniref:HepT-like ribonuclease domain-containing protein n=1 Tax=Methylocystis parvus TaxID=134 RepID=UPI003C72CD34
MKEERIHTLLDQVEKALCLCASYLDGLSRDDFLKDNRTQQAVAMNLIILGEAVSRLEARFPEFLARFPGMPWQSMRGMRNRIAHGYFELDMEIVFDTARMDLPELQKSLSALRAAVDENN